MNDTAYEAALRILVRRPHAEKELRTKLVRKEFSRDQIAEAVARLKNEKHLDDAKLARDLVRWFMDYRPMGRRGVRFKMMQRGFLASDIEAALAENYPAELEKKLARTLMERRPRATREKTARFLLSRGFAQDVVLAVLDAGA